MAFGSPTTDRAVSFAAQAASFTMKGTTEEPEIETDRPRDLLLCLHGWRSNAAITKLQLTHLGLLSEAYEPVYINGPIIESSAADEEVEMMTPGPYYSWTTQHGEDEANINEIVNGLKTLLEHLVALSKSTLGIGYSAVYGFSQGAAVAVLLSNETIRNRLLSEMGEGPLPYQPWNVVFTACAANTRMVDAVAKHLGLDPQEFPADGCIPLPSVHFIGLTDPHKVESERLMRLFDSSKALPCYLDSGHEIPASTELLHYLAPEAMMWCQRMGSTSDGDNFQSPFADENGLEEGELYHIQKVVASHEGGAEMVPIMNIMDEIQNFQDQCAMGRADHDRDISRPHLGKYGQYVLSDMEMSQMNIFDMLGKANPKDIAFRAPGATPLSYGELVDFIWGGDGDLRRIGAQPNFRVAYSAPFGVLSATAFVAVAAQCTAVPLDPGYNATDLTLAFDQLDPDLVIVFEGVEGADAVEEAAAAKGIPVHQAKAVSGTCGLYRFEQSATAAGINLTDPVLSNPPDNDGLILRTSGTTSKPKVVPLRMSSIVSNAQVIAKSLGLVSNDVALNAMPLFHIGGLSANLLSSMAAGAGVILLSQFNVEEFSDYLTGAEGEVTPTWYSSVPTMHAAITQYHEDLEFKHTLRFIRSGADAMPQSLALKMQALFGVPIVLTYSMTEQMPITQPATGFSIPTHKPTSVGRTVAASMCLVDRNMRPLPKDESGETTGEVCISGPMVTAGYLNNPTANASTFFRMGGMEWFRTGDMGRLDEDGYLFLTGRSKELIKRGGEQVSPYEVEEVLRRHPDITKCLVFAIPDPFWGELVGVAIIGDERDAVAFRKELNQFLKGEGMQPFKIPEVIVFVKEDQISKTRSNKYIRIGLAEKLGLGADAAKQKLQDMKPVRFHEAAVGVRFVLALWVMYNHIGEFDDVDYRAGTKKTIWDYTRSWCFHPPLFFFVGGFLLAAGTHLPVTGPKDLMNFYSLRIASLHPMYLVSIACCAINLIAKCRPENFIQEFDMIRRPLPTDEFVCQATQAEMSWGATFTTSMFTYIFALQAWPMTFPISWFISFYTWFSSVYIFCIFIFPYCHKPFFGVRNDIKGIWRLTIYWTISLYAYIGLWSIYYFALDDEDIALKNWFALSAYLLPIGWVPCFSLGIACYFLFRHYSPNTGKHVGTFGAITDSISLVLLMGYLSYGFFPKEMDPDFNETSLDSRVWAGLVSRMASPIGFLWFWGLAVGSGYTASLLSTSFLVGWLAPASYNMFLFHQPVAEWYYAATRGRWWAFPKNFYWFSPYPFPVKGWEFFVVVLLTVSLSVFMEAYVNEWLVRHSAILLRMCTGGSQRNAKSGESVLDVVASVIYDLTYAEVTADTDLSEAGLSSMTSILLVSEIKKVYKSLKLSVRDCANSKTVGDLVQLVEGRISEATARPEFVLSTRTSIVAGGGNLEESGHLRASQLSRSSLARHSQSSSGSVIVPRRQSSTGSMRSSGSSPMSAISGADSGNQDLRQSLRRASQSIDPTGGAIIGMAPDRLVQRKSRRMSYVVDS